MHEDRLREIVKEELLRPEIQEFLTTQTQTGMERFGSALKHPFALAVIGFALTSVVGTLISQTVADRRQRDLEQQNALEAVRGFASDASELRVSQSFLLEAMERGTKGKTLDTIKSDYDKTYLSWNATRYRNYLTVRSFFGFTYANYAEQAISRTIHQDFKAFNACLNQAYDGLQTGQEPRATVNACLEASGREPKAARDAFDQGQELVFQCSRKIFDDLHHFITNDLNCGSKAWTEPSVTRKGFDAPITVTRNLYESYVAECATGTPRAYQSFASQYDASCTKDDAGEWSLPW